MTRLALLSLLLSFVLSGPAVAGGFAVTEQTAVTKNSR